MTDRALGILEQALKLPAEERAQLASELNRSFDREEQDLSAAEWDAVWAAEIESRQAGIDSGESTTHPWEEVQRKMDDWLRTK